MRIQPIISTKEKVEPLLPQTIVTARDNPEKKSEAKAKEKTEKKHMIDSLLEVISSLFYSLIFMVLWLAPGKK